MIGKEGSWGGEDPSAASFEKSVFVIPSWSKKEVITLETTKTLGYYERHAPIQSPQQDH